MGARLFNLNNYDIVPKEDATVVLRLKDINGVKQPDMYLRSNKAQKKNPVTFEDIQSGRATWSPTVEISEKGSPQEYKAVIKWWFDSARTDVDYSNSINERFECLGDVFFEVSEAKSWLLNEGAFNQDNKGVYNRRKKDINKFLKGWLNRQRKRKVYRKARG